MKNVPFFALAIGIAVAPIAFAATPPELQLSDPAGDVITVDSTGSVVFSGLASCVAGATCHTTLTSVAPGVISWSGTIGPFTVSSAVGKTKPNLPSPQMDVSLQNLTTGATGGMLALKWTDTGFSGSGPANMAAGTIFPSGSGSVTYTSYVDNGNAPFGTGTTVGTLGPTSSSGVLNLTGLGPTAQPFSMTEVAVITLSPNSVFDTDDLLIASKSIPFTGCTVTQGGWGAPAHGNNAGAFLNANFAAGFPSGVTIGGFPFKLVFDSPGAVRAFLPQGGPPSFLNASAMDPTSRTSAGVFAGQVLALTLNVTLYHMGTLTLTGTGTTLDGKTVSEILGAADQALAGGVLPPGVASYSALNDVIDSLNSSFDGCVENSFGLSHLQ